MIAKQETTELLGLNRFAVDEEEAHIILDKEKCRQCDNKICLKICPAGLYVEKDGEIIFDAAGCLECGTCRLVCKNGGISKWTYPRATFGVAYRHG